ncbi:hypothetical protein EV401DRAFT_1888996 [Pisolithus croceorrhizus]|nr:hypothetical protein EV401DRAFT_1888996 [Pisolithus croceorrhizus]
MRAVFLEDWMIWAQDGMNINNRLWTDGWPEVAVGASNAVIEKTRIPIISVANDAGAQKSRPLTVHDVQVAIQGVRISFAVDSGGVPAGIRDSEDPLKALEHLWLMDKASLSISDSDLVDILIHGWLGQNSKGHQLSDIQARMRLKISGDEVEIGQSYVPVIFLHLVNPLSQMDRYNAGENRSTFHKAVDLGRAPKETPGGTVPDIEEALEVHVVHSFSAFRDADSYGRCKSGHRQNENGFWDGFWRSAFGLARSLLQMISDYIADYRGRCLN